MRKIEDKSKEEIVKIGRKIGEAFAAEKAGIVTLLTEEQTVKAFEIMTDYFYRQVCCIPHLKQARVIFLLCHAAFVLPAAIACYYTDGNLRKLKGNTVYLNRILDANIEGCRAIERAGHKILPASGTDYESAAYRKNCLRFFRLMCANGLGKLCASDHAMNAVEEMSTLNRDMKTFFDEAGAIYPVWQTLERDAGRYLK